MMLSMLSMFLQAAPAPAREEIYLFLSLGLLGLAIILLILELFIPTAGALSVMTGVSSVASIASMFVYDTTWGGIYLAALCAGSPIVVVLIFKVWSKTPIAHRMILRQDADGQTKSDDDDHGSANPSVSTVGSSAKSMSRQLAPFIGRSGIAVTTLRPIGFIRIDGTRMEALAESGFIAEGASIRVIDVLEGQLKVRESAAG